MNLKNNYKKITILILLLMTMVGTLFTTYADAYETFTVRAVIPDNQRNRDVEYYDLRMQQDQQQDLVLQITNKGNEDMIARVSLNNGTTGDNALKQFTVDKAVDPSMKYPLTHIANLKETEILVPANETREAIIQVAMPQESIDGVIVGAVNVVADTLTNKTPQDQQTGVNLNTRISYSVGMVLNMTDTVVERNLNLVGVGSKLTAFRPTFTTTLQNDQAVLMNSVDIIGTIYKKGSDKVVATVNTSGSGILPNSNFDVVYDMDKKKIEPGEYDMELKVQHEDRIWEWKDVITIDGDTADSLNSQIKFDSNENNMFIFIIFGLLILILLILLYILIKRLNERDKQAQ